MCLYPSIPMYLHQPRYYRLLSRNVSSHHHALSCSLILLLRFTLLDLDALSAEVIRIWCTTLAKAQLLRLLVELLSLLLGGCVDEPRPYEEVGAYDEDDADPAMGGHLVVGRDRVVDEAVLPFCHVLDYIVHRIHGDYVVEVFGSM
jgi:hypothetical protein